jgi:ribosomal protein S18 acetylase RimI-like enzyme
MNSGVRHHSDHGDYSRGNGIGSSRNLRTWREEINAIHHQAFPAIFAGPGPVERDRAHWGSGIGRAGYACYVAEEAGTVVGFVAAAVINETHSLLQPARIVRIGSVGVAAHMRGQGIGSALMRHAEIWASQVGASELRLNVWAFNEPALSMYRELGYELHSYNFAKVLRSGA